MWYKRANTEPWQMTKEQWLQTVETVDKAAVWASGKLFTGNHHGEALQKAIEEGAVIKGEEGYLVDAKTGADINYSGQSDLFITTKGNIIDRFEASSLYRITASENIERRFAPHKESVEKAISEGKPVPQNVINEYK